MSKPEWFDEHVGGLIDKVQAENRTLIQSVREENRQTIQELGGQIQQVKQEQAKQAADMMQLKQEVKKMQNEKGSASSPTPGGDDPFKPKEITVTGFCQFKEISTDGWTREMFTPLLAKLIRALPEDLRDEVVPIVRTIGFRNLKFSVDIQGDHAREIQQRWQNWFDEASTTDVASDMSDDVQIGLSVERIKVYTQRTEHALYQSIHHAGRHGTSPGAG